MLDTETERLEAQRKRVTGGILRISSMKLPDILLVILGALQCGGVSFCVNFEGIGSPSNKSGERQENN